MCIFILFIYYFMYVCMHVCLCVCILFILFYFVLFEKGWQPSYPMFSNIFVVLCIILLRYWPVITFGTAKCSHTVFPSRVTVWLTVKCIQSGSCCWRLYDLDVDLGSSASTLTSSLPVFSCCCHVFPAEFQLSQVVCRCTSPYLLWSLWSPVNLFPAVRKHVLGSYLVTGIALELYIILYWWSLMFLSILFNLGLPILRRLHRSLSFLSQTHRGHWGGAENTGREKVGHKNAVRRNGTSSAYMF